MTRLKLVLALAIIYIANSVFGQNMNKADDYYKYYKYTEALSEYKKLAEQDKFKDNYHVISRIAACYKHLFDYPDAVKWYNKVYLHKELQANDLKEYADVLRSNENYEKSYLIYNEYCEKAGKKDSLQYFQNLCLWPIKNINLRSNLEVTETNINTGGISLGYYSMEGNFYYGMPAKQTNEEKTVYYDLAVGKILDSVTIEKAIALPGKINHTFYEAAPYITKSKNLIYYTANASEELKYKAGKNAKKHLSKDGQNKLEIYGSYIINGNYSKPFTLSFDNENFDYAFANFNDDESIIYFASDVEGGYGGFDIYSAKKITDSTFEAPVNLGPLVNTSSDESYPFFSDNKLYFTSRGLNGFGGSDIFEAELKNNSVTKVSNAGRPLNSSKDDFAFFKYKDKNSGYISSNRDGKNGQDKIYYFFKPEINDSIKGIVLDNITSEALAGVRVELSVAESKNNYKLIETITTQNDGHFALKVDKKRMYKVTFNLNGYKVNKYILPEQDNENFVLSRSEVKIMLDKVRMIPEVKAGNMFTINNIYFDFDKSEVRNDSYSSLDSLASFLKRNPDARIELGAHTDAVGSNEYNDDLSNKRANACCDYLVKAGITRNRIVPKGYGERKLVNNCREKEQCPDSEHQKNRRVEILFL
jgi:outer membrane protein OmpA-like peptidoglycan-associated protein